MKNALAFFDCLVQEMTPLIQNCKMNMVIL